MITLLFITIHLYNVPDIRNHYIQGPALTAVWSKEPPLTVRCLSPLSGFESRSGHFEKVASDLGLGGGFRLVLRFPPLLTTG